MLQRPHSGPGADGELLHVVDELCYNNTMTATHTQSHPHPDWIDPELDLVGVDGNAYSIMGFVSKGLRRAGNSPDVIKAYTDEATTGDYQHLLSTSMVYAGMVT